MKTTFSDFLIVVFFLVILSLPFITFYYGSRLRTECEDKGGVLLSSWQCIKADRIELNK